MKDFNNYRFNKFDFHEYSHKYWEFKSQINSDESKVLIRINPENVFSYTGYKGWTNYVLKLDRTHCMFLKNWQYFEGYYGVYAVLDKNYFRVAEAKEPFEDMASQGDMLTWDDALKIAKKQQAYDEKNEYYILVRQY